MDVKRIQVDFKWMSSGCQVDVELMSSGCQVDSNSILLDFATLT